jgi:hypothetical protein
LCCRKKRHLGRLTQEKYRRGGKTEKTKTPKNQEEKERAN